jgi:hypothetical protein
MSEEKYVWISFRVVKERSLLSIPLRILSAADIRDVQMRECCS